MLRVPKTGAEEAQNYNNNYEKYGSLKPYIPLNYHEDKCSKKVKYNERCRGVRKVRSSSCSSCTDNIRKPNFQVINRQMGGQDNGHSKPEP